MSALLFAIFDADASRSRLVLAERKQAKAQEAYDKAGRVVLKRASSRSQEVRQRAHDALRAALDVLDECRAAVEAEQATLAGLEQAQQLAQAAAVRGQESPGLCQHRDAHA